MCIFFVFFVDTKLSRLVSYNIFTKENGAWHEATQLAERLLASSPPAEASLRLQTYFVATLMKLRQYKRAESIIASLEQAGLLAPMLHASINSADGSLFSLLSFLVCVSFFSYIQLCLNIRYKLTI